MLEQIDAQIARLQTEHNQIIQQVNEWTTMRLKTEGALVALQNLKAQLEQGNHGTDAVSNITNHNEHSTA